MNVSGERILDRDRRYEVGSCKLSYLSSRIFGAIAGLERGVDLKILLARPHASYSLRTLIRRGLINGHYELTVEGETFAERVRIPLNFPTERQPIRFTFDDDRLPRRFWSKVITEPMSGCWLWLATTSERGYGRFGVNACVMAAHRVSYMMLIGPIPEDLELDHRCRNTTCVNPDHVEPVTHQVNVQRGWDAVPESRRVFRGVPYQGGRS